MWQQLQYGQHTFQVQASPGCDETQNVPYVLLEDIQDHFPDATKFMCGNNLVSFMRASNNNRLKPLRFAYRPGMIVEIEVAGSCMSPRLLTMRNTIGLQSTSVSPADKDKFQQSATLFEDYVKALESGQRKQADLIRGDFQQCFSTLQESLDRNHDLQRQLNDMQQAMLQMQQQALDRLTDLNGRVQALLTQTYELHEYQIPRLFIVLPINTSKWDPVSLLSKQFRLYFLCECDEHTKALSGEHTKIPHHIHIAKHEGYDIQRPTKFFQKYGRYMLTLLEMTKYGINIAACAVPPLATVSVPGAIDMVKDSLATISPSAVNQSIEYLQTLSSKDPKEQGPAEDTETDSFTGQEALEGADLRHLETFIKSKDQHRALGGLYRTVTHEGHVKWICIDHYHLAYKKQDQHAFATVVEVNGGCYDPHLGRVSVRLGSKIQAVEFFDTLAKARRVDELDVTFDWECTAGDLEAFEDPIKIAALSILRLDLRRFRTSFGSKLLLTSTRYEVLARIVALPRMKMIHIILPMDLVELSRLQPKSLSRLPKLSFEVVSGWDERKGLGRKGLGRKGFERLAEALKTNSTLTTLSLEHDLIGDNGAVAMSEALITNSTLTTLDLAHNSIGDNGAVAMSEALMTNSTLTTLDLAHNSIGDNGAVALSGALIINSTLTTLRLTHNSIGDNGAVALSEAIITNSTLTTLRLTHNSIGDNGAVALSGTLMANSILTNLSLAHNSIGDNGAVAMSEALMTNSILTTLDLERSSIGDNGAVALSGALITNSTLTTLDLAHNSIGENGAQALSEALMTNSTLTTLRLTHNSIGDNGAVALSGALIINSTLTTLRLTHNSIGDSGAQALSEALMTNSTLNTLHLHNNKIGPNGAQALSEALKTNSTLTTLSLWNNSIGDNGALALSEALITNSTLTTLDLAHNSIGDNGAVALSEALMTNSTLTTLDLAYNSIGESGAMALSIVSKAGRSNLQINYQ